MEKEISCKCGKEAIGFITGEGWLCLDCFNREEKRIHTSFPPKPKLS